MQGLFLRLILCVVICVSALTAHAQQQSPFSEDELLRCAADTPQLIAYMQSVGDEAANLEDEGAAQQLIAGENAQTWLENKGWQPERYSYVLHQVTQGYAAIQMRQNSGDINAQMQQAMATPGMPPEVMAQMQQAMQQLSAAQQGAGVSPKEMALIEAYLPRVEMMFGE